MAIISGAFAAMKALSSGKKIGFTVLGVLAIGVAVFAFIQAADKRHENTIEIAKEAGASEAVAAGQDLTLKQIGNANEAGIKIRNNVSTSRFCECVRSATRSTSGNCVKHLKNVAVPDRPDDPGKYCAGLQSTRREVQRPGQ